MDQITTSLTAILTAIVGVAIISVLVSKNANTSQVLTAGGNAFSTALGTAMGGVTGFTPTMASAGAGFAGSGFQLTIPSVGVLGFNG